MNNYNLQLACSQNQPLKENVGSSLMMSTLFQYHKTKLVSHNNKEIELYGPYFGSYCAFMTQGTTGTPDFAFIIHKAEHSTQEDDFHTGWTNEEIYRNHNFSLGNVKVKVILDDT